MFTIIINQCDSQNVEATRPYRDQSTLVDGVQLYIDHCTA